MPRRTRAWKRVERDAAFSLLFYAIAILGPSLVIMELTVWRVDRNKPQAFYRELPEVDFSGVVPEQREALLKHWNMQDCPCGCDRSVASCRVHHTSCSWSRETVRKAVAAAK